MPDVFLRRFLKSMYKNGVISPEAFRCRQQEVGISLHKRDDSLQSEDQLREYQAAFQLPSGDLPGIFELPSICFDGMNSPKPAPIEHRDELYSTLHYELQPCPDDYQAAQLAKFAVKLLDFLKQR